MEINFSKIWTSPQTLLPSVRHPSGACISGTSRMEDQLLELEVSHRSLLTIPLSQAPVLAMCLWYLAYGGPIPGTWVYRLFSLCHCPHSSTCPGHVSQVLTTRMLLFRNLNLPTVKSKTCSPKSSNCLGHVSEVLTAWTCYKVEFQESKVSFPEHTPFNCNFPLSQATLWGITLLLNYHLNVSCFK